MARLWIDRDYPKFRKGHYQKDTRFVGGANWNRNNQQVNVNSNNPDNQNSNNGSRSAAGLGALHGFYPAAEHAADFTKFGLHLENTRFIGDLKFQVQAYF